MAKLSTYDELEVLEGDGSERLAGYNTSGNFKVSFTSLFAMALDTLVLPNAEAESDAEGGSIEITLGNGDGEGNGGSFVFNGGTSATNVGGSFSVDAGDALGAGAGGGINLSGGGSATGPGGAVALTGGNSDSGATAGGAVTLTGGNGYDTADGGDVTIARGEAMGSGTHGNVLILGLPTIDPMVANAIWLEDGVLTISAG